MSNQGLNNQLRVRFTWGIAISANQVGRGDFLDEPPFLLRVTVGRATVLLLQLSTQTFNTSFSEVNEFNSDNIPA